MRLREACREKGLGGFRLQHGWCCEQRVFKISFNGFRKRGKRNGLRSFRRYGEQHNRRLVVKLRRRNDMFAEFRGCLLRIIDGIDAYLDRHGIGSVRDLVGTVEI